MNNPAITQTRVSTRRDRQAAADRAAIARHHAALAALDAADRTNAIIDAMKRESGPIPAAGPRTASHPMATRIDPPETRGPQTPATTIPGGAVTFEEPPTLRMTGQIAFGLALTAAFLFGLALGKAL